MKMILKLALILLIIPSICFAETIILKSGKKMEGEIVERTDRYIKIQLPGIPIPMTYFLEDIESIEGEKLTAALRTEKVIPQQTDLSKIEKVDIVETDIEVDEQQAAIRFLDTLDSIEKNYFILIDNTHRMFKEAISAERRGEAERIVLNAAGEIKQYIQQIKGLYTPENCIELKELSIKCYGVAIQELMGILKPTTFIEQMALSKEKMKYCGDVVVKKATLRQKIDNKRSKD